MDPLVYVEMYQRCVGFTNCSCELLMTEDKRSPWTGCTVPNKLAPKVVKREQSR
jgi:hypothetical protein